jgi:hypothetical protein
MCHVQVVFESYNLMLEVYAVVLEESAASILRINCSPS